MKWLFAITLLTQTHAQQVEPQENLKKEAAQAIEQPHSKLLPIVDALILDARMHYQNKHYAASSKSYIQAIDKIRGTRDKEREALQKRLDFLLLSLQQSTKVEFKMLLREKKPTNEISKLAVERVFYLPDSHNITTYFLLTYEKVEASKKATLYHNFISQKIIGLFLNGKHKESEILGNEANLFHSCGGCVLPLDRPTMPPKITTTSIIN